MSPTGRIVPCQEFETGRPKLSLDGAWSFSYDPDHIGEKEKWFSPQAHLPEKTSVPGCPQVKKYASAGKAVPVENEGWIPFKHACNAPAWHAKTFSVPAGWQSKEIWLHMGGLYPAATIWCNGRLVGHTKSSRTPLRCNLTRFLYCGEKNTLAIKLYLPQGSRLEGMFDGKVWAGIYRSIWLEIVEAVCFKDIFIQGRIQPASARIEVMLQGTSAHNMALTCELGMKGQAQHYVGTAGIAMKSSCLPAVLRTRPQHFAQRPACNAVHSTAGRCGQAALQAGRRRTVARRRGLLINQGIACIYILNVDSIGIPKIHVKGGSHHGW